MEGNLYQRMLNVSTEVMNVEKNTTVATGSKSSYKAVADFDVVMAVKKAEAKYGIISIPIRQELVDTQVMSYTDSYGNQKTQFVDIVRVTMSIINVDDPSDCVEVSAYGRGIDTSDKSFGKASTYARKYCLLNAYKIATGEDPDKDASEAGRFSTPASPASAPATPSPAAQTEAKGVQQPAAQPAQGEDNLLVEALKAATEAKSPQEVNEVWIKYRGQFGKDVNFVKAIANNPFNPKKNSSRNKK